MLPENENFSARTTLIVFVLVIVVIVGASMLVLAARPAPVMITIQSPPATATPLPEGTLAPITVYITGKVRQPAALLTLAPGSRVADALQAAGGATDDADLSRVNLAAVLRDGDQVHVPAIGENIDNSEQPAATGQIVAINSATLAELETLPGVGSSLAAAIIEYRQQVGRIENAADLDEVRGIGAALLEQILPLIVFD